MVNCNSSGNIWSAKLACSSFKLKSTSDVAAAYATLAQVNAKFTTPSCPTTQYLRGDGSCAAFPAIPTVPVINRVRVTTAADGTYTWALPTACSAGTTPVVSITPESATAGDAVSHRITAVSNTSVSVFAGRSAGLSVLSLTVLGVPAGAAIPVHLIAICP